MHISLFGTFMSKLKYAGNDLIWKALLLHGERFVEKGQTFDLFSHT